MPNIFANIVFYSWPLVVFWLLKRRPVNQAIFLSITLAILFLPYEFSLDLPLVPPLDRDTLTSLSLIVFLFLLRKKFRLFQPSATTMFIFGYLIAVVISSELNADPIVLGARSLPGLSHYDAFSNVARTVLWLMPFFLGRYFLNNVKDMQAIFKMLVIMGLLYTLPMLIELRMSPQIHNWVYGYAANNFMQQVRGDGYRPVVFLGHGLSLAFWFSTCLIAAAALQKNKIRYSKFSSTKILCYMLLILVLCKTWSALAYALVGILFITKLAPSKQIKLSMLFAALILLYPLSKTTGVFPDKEIVSTIQGFSVERAESLQYRFENEDILLNHALERPYFGWNGWGRNRLYSDYDGKDITVTDGRWIIEFGINGAMGFLFYYAILLMPLYVAMKNVNYIQDEKDKIYFSTLAFILAICIIDSVPNTGMGSMHLLFAGALLGQAELIKKQKYLLNNEKTNVNKR